jgi:hypothetical protein
MKILADKVEWFSINTDRNNQATVPVLMGSIWAWDGQKFNVKPHASPSGFVAD